MVKRVATANMVAEARKILTKALRDGPPKAAERTYRSVFTVDLKHELVQMATAGFTHSQVADLLRTAGFDLAASTVREYIKIVSPDGKRRRSGRRRTTDAKDDRASKKAVAPDADATQSGDEVVSTLAERYGDSLPSARRE